MAAITSLPAAAAFGQPFGQGNHAVSRWHAGAARRDAEAEALSPPRIRQCLHGFVSEHDANTAAYAQALVARIKTFFHHDRSSFLSRTAYSGFPALPERHVLLLPGQEHGLLRHQFTPEVNTAIQDAHPAAFASWDRSYGSAQGLARQPDGTLEVHCTGLAVSRADPGEVLYPMSLVGVDAGVAARVVFAAVCACINSDLRDNPRTTLTTACNTLHGQLGQVFDGGDLGPCSETAHFRLNWAPFTADEARFLAFGKKVSVDVLPAVRFAIQHIYPGDGFDIEDDADLTLEIEAVPE